MSVLLGNTNISKVCLGNTEIDKVYKGDELLYSGEPFPSNYQLCNWIGCTGSQYIDTELIPSTTFAAKFKYQETVATGSNYLCGCRTSSSSQMSHGVSGGTNQHNVVIQGQGITTPNNYRAVGNIYEIEYDLAPDLSGTGSIDCITTGDVFTGNQTNSYTATTTFKIFATHTSQRHPGARIYYFKMWDNGVLVRDYVPCLDNNGVPCMRDLVNRKTYYDVRSSETPFEYELAE